MAGRTEEGTSSNASFQIAAMGVSTWWNKGDEEQVGPFIADQILSNLTTEARLSDCQPQAQFDSRSPNTAQHPFQRMYVEPKLEESVSEIVRKAFKFDLVIHHKAGQSIPAYVGDRPNVQEGEDRISRSYLDRIESLERLERQGDGVRSFVSIVARVVTESRPIQLIDEPEAFLHPPQAKLIAESVVKHGSGRQTLVATHSSDVLQGLLSGGAERVSVLRLARTRGTAPLAPSRGSADQ